jgi:cytochrome c oxidase subunit 2
LLVQSGLRAPTKLITVIAAAAAAAGCSGVQSALAPSGRDADRIATLFWWMTGGSAVVWLIVIGLAIYYARRASGTRNPRRDRALVVGGGVIFPTVVITVLLVYGLAMIPETVARAPEGSLRIAVTGEQWWWRVKYIRPSGEEITLANEIRLPVGEPAEFRLDSDNVIHSFWIPPLGGKMDMIPGRITYLTVRPTRTGIFRGACAEYCGTSHALMVLTAIAEEPPAFRAWLAAEAAASPGAAAAGREAFLAEGCGACHTVRGTEAAGRVGPDLSHLGARATIGAGTLPMSRAAIARFIAAPAEVKPGATMPAYDMLDPATLDAIAGWLEGLR